MEHQEDEPATLTLADVRVSQSSITARQICGHYFKLSVLQGIRPRFTPAPLKRGTLVHAGNEAALRCQWWSLKTGWWDEHTDPERRLRRMLSIGGHAIREKQDAWLKSSDIAPHITQELREAADRLTDDACLIFRREFEALGVHHDRWETVETPDGHPLIEYTLTTDPESVGLHPRFKEVGGTIDWVAREVETGSLWLWDFKTGKDISDEDHFLAQLQAGFYLYLLNVIFGMVIVGTINYQIRAAVPKQPKMNKTKKKGQTKPGMSTADCLTTWEVYKQALLDQGLNPADYQDMRGKLQAKVWQRADRYYRTPKEVRNVWHGTVVPETNNMVKTEGVYPRALNPFRCGFCKLREYCMAQLRGHDAAFLRRTTFMVEGEAAFYPSIEIEDDTQ